MVYTIVVHLYAKDSAESISKLHNKLAEASTVYSKDRETISWFVMQDHRDKRAFTIVERYEHESVRRLITPFADAFSCLISAGMTILLMKCRKYIESEISSRGTSIEALPRGR